MGYKNGAALKTAFETYTIRAQRGSGGSGDVYEVMNEDGLSFAAKILDHKKASRSRLQRFQNEIHFCTKTEHPNIVRVLGHGVTDKGETFYIMPLYSGTLRNLISTGIPLDRVLPYFGQILDGMEAAHLKGVWHRDTKHENILHSDPENILVVADFGIAHFEEEELLTAVETRNDERLANFVYSAPEQKTRGRALTEKADVFALGLILNEMFTQQVPLGAHSEKIAERAPNFSYLDGLVEQMTMQDPALRPSVEQVKLQLIARRQQYISLQKIDELKKVVHEDEVTDPLITDPIRAKDFDYDNGHLIVRLSRIPNPLWKERFGAQATESFLHMGPPTVRFQGDTATVSVRKDIVVQQKNYFEGWVRNANGLYEQAVKQQMAEQKRLKERQLQEQLAKEKERLEIRNLLKPQGR